MRRWYAAGLACAAMLTVSACGGLSTTSPVQRGLDVGAVQQNEVRVEANPVAPGSSPTQVVAGFIRAAAASDNEYQAARSYLSSTPEATWQPDSSVVVFTDESSLSVTSRSDGSVSAVAKATARIDGNGRYEEMPPNSSVEVNFELQRVSGEWRITKVPDTFGTWLSESDLERLYDPFRVYFVSAAERRLVPDVRWFPLGTGLATRLARAVLAGVPDYLKGAVRTDVPTGTRLAVDAVPIDSGTARIDLTATRLGSDPAQRQNLAAQFLATVSQAPGVQRLDLQLEGTELQVPGGETSVDSLSALGFSTPTDPDVKPVLRKGSTLVNLDPETVGDLGSGARGAGSQTQTLPSIAPGWAYLAMSRSGREIAAVGGDRAQVARWRGTQQVQVLNLGSMLTRPSYDRQDVLWVGGRDGATAKVWAINTAADPTDTTRSRPAVVAAPWLAGRNVVSIRIAPDGQRAALISTDRSGRNPRVDVSGVVRQPNGLPVSLTAPLSLAPSLTLALDLVWVDDATLAVLGRKTDVVRPWLVPLGGQISAGPDISGAQSITTVNAERGLVVTTSGGEVFIRAGNRWQSVGAGSDFLVPAR
jgi:hypothetical protein